MQQSEETGSLVEHDTLTRSVVADGMRIDYDVPIPMEDGVVLRADVFRPIEDRRCPVLLSYGPYAKGLAFQEGYPDQWRLMCRDHPDVPDGSTNKYQNWEVVDPEKWVPYSYVCVRVDSRGAGRSPGVLDLFSPRETKDFSNCIEWAGRQAWSNGKVGLSGISYYAINQWHVAALQPPHLAAICPWEGAADHYRDWSYHGGILSMFTARWFPEQVKSVQHGVGERGRRDPNTGELVAGPETLSEEELARNRRDMAEQIEAHPFDDAFHRSRSPDWSTVKVPLLSSANWGGQGLHPRGNFEGFTQSASTEKWLESHGLEHWTHYYTDYGRELQKRFFDYFLKGEGDWPESQPRVLLQVRSPGERFEQRAENEWPLARTQWTRFYLDATSRSLLTDAPGSPASVTYQGFGEGVTFSTPPLEEETEITGPVAVKLFVSSVSEDVDLFLILRVFDPDGEEVHFKGTLDPHTPIGQGWLRASHRALEPELSTEWRPYHSHDEREPLTPGEVYELDVEIWPTSLVVPASYRIALTVQGKDYEYGGEPVNVGWFVLSGCGPFLHDNPHDRPAEIFGGDVIIHTGSEQPSSILLPVIPQSGED
jgi:predicted acyl esterase